MGDVQERVQDEGLREDDILPDNNRLFVFFAVVLCCNLIGMLFSRARQEYPWAQLVVVLLLLIVAPALLLMVILEEQAHRCSEVPPNNYIMSLGFFGSFGVTSFCSGFLGKAISDRLIDKTAALNSLVAFLWGAFLFVFVAIVMMALFGVLMMGDCLELPARYKNH